MTPDQLADRLRPHYPVLDSLPTALRTTVLATEVQHHLLPTDALLFEEGTPCRGFPMLVSGEVRVARGHPQGRSLELYRVTPGELCVASTSCLVAGRALVAHGHTAQPTELALLTPRGFEQWLTVPEFRRFVFGIFADRLADLMALAEAVAFQRLDQRLATALLGQGHLLLTTHQRLADELGTVREIVTRLLKRFERAGWVALGRERIDILDPGALRALAAGAADSAAR